MMWTPEDLEVITEASTGQDEAASWQRVTEHFGPRGDFTFARACDAVDRLRRGEALDLGNGEVLARDFGIGGRIIADITPAADR